MALLFQLILHFDFTIYLGMKAYKSLSDSSLRLFRPDLNMIRLKNSMERLSMPGYDFEPKELIECIAELVRVGKSTAQRSMLNFVFANVMF